MCIPTTISTSHPCELQGTIRFRQCPHLGSNDDIDGNRWDVHAILGETVQAVPQDNLHDYYTDTSGDICGYFNVGTSGSGIVSQTWKPYNYEIVGK